MKSIVKRKAGSRRTRTAARSSGQADLSGHQTLTAAVTAALRSEIISGELAPGSKLSISGTAKRMRVSLSGIREALSSLTSEGLVEPEAHKGYSVTTVSVEDLKDLTEVRVAIDVLAIRRAIKRGDAEWEARILSAGHLLSKTPLNDNPGSHGVSSQWEKRHRDFHLALISACESPRLIHLHTTTFEQSERYRRLSIGYARSPAEVMDSHQRLLVPFLQRDEDAAIEECTEHIQRTTRIILEHATADKWSSRSDRTASVPAKNTAPRRAR